MENVLKYLAEITSPILAFCAFTIAYLTFRRQKTLENENHIFKYKLEQYYKTLKRFHELLSFLENEIDDSYEGFKNKEITRSELEEIADGIDDEIDDAQDDILPESLFLPAKITNKIDSIWDLLYENDLAYNEKKEEYAKSQILLAKLADLLDELHTEMREDIGIKVLDKKLHRRTRS